MRCKFCGHQVTDIARWKRIKEARKHGVSWAEIAEREGERLSRVTWLWAVSRPATAPPAQRTASAIENFPRQLSMRANQMRAKNS
jgi:hypothetical protein